LSDLYDRSIKSWSVALPFVSCRRLRFPMKKGLVN